MIDYLLFSMNNEQSIFSYILYYISSKSQVKLSTDAALPAPHELGARRCVPPQVANLRNLERGKLVRGLLVSVCPLNCLFL